MKTPSRTAFKWRPGEAGICLHCVFLFLESPHGGCFAPNVAVLRHGGCVAALVLMREDDKEAKSRLKLQEREAGHLRGHPRRSVCHEGAAATVPRDRKPMMSLVRCWCS